MQLSYNMIDLSLSRNLVTTNGRKPKNFRNIIVTLHNHGLTGIGSAVPAYDYGTNESSLAHFLDKSTDILTGYDLEKRHLLFDLLIGEVGGQWSAFAAIDMAIHDLLGKQANLPLFQYLGLDSRKIPYTAATIGICEPDVAVIEAQPYLNWQTLKLKMGSCPDYDRVLAIRSAFTGCLWVDGNGAFPAKDALDIAKKLAACGVDVLEQPVAPGQYDLLREIRTETSLLLIADEDIHGPESVLALAGCVHGINIKLLKCGGIKRAIDMITLARYSGLKIVLGCKVENSVGVTATAHLAGLADYVDLDGHLGINGDPYLGVMIGSDGKICLPLTPGLGLETI
ncbi:dipeptide epimerase [Enterobacter sp. ECC-019]|uniref:dipeptide epimerase n=1 Tax=Enterobacter sp. ECC-019 TaxID=3116478 RepID=UPI00375451A8